MADSKSKMKKQLSLSTSQSSQYASRKLEGEAIKNIKSHFVGV